MDTVLQMWPPQGRAAQRGRNPYFNHALFNAPQAQLGLVGHKGTLPAHGQHPAPSLKNTFLAGWPLNLY